MVVPPVVVVVVVVVVSATTDAGSLGCVFDDTFLVGGSAEGARETLRLRAVVASGDARAAFCDRVAGIFVVLDGTGCVCVRECYPWESGVVDNEAQWCARYYDLARVCTCISDYLMLTFDD